LFSAGVMAVQLEGPLPPFLHAPGRTLHDKINYQYRILRVTRECKDECVPDPTELHCVEPTDTTV
jgi:hypothetical protein